MKAAEMKARVAAAFLKLVERKFVWEKRCGIGEFHSDAEFVWLGSTPLDKLALPPKHFFAARQPDGSHRFYAS